MRKYVRFLNSKTCSEEFRDPNACPDYRWGPKFEIIGSDLFTCVITIY